MLILTRENGQSIIIGDGLDAVEVEIVRIGPKSVKLGINAPKTVPIHRKEVYLQILKERAAK